jgi:ABC-type branched-subunit amino acid transport system substrate-binding protein
MCRFVQVCLLVAVVLTIGTFGAYPAETNSLGQKEILLGMSTALSGPVANLGQDMLQGVLAGLERANRAGGVQGCRLRLTTLDDGYEPARTAPNMRQLIEKDKVLAIIGDVGAPTAVAAAPIANEDKTLFFAAFTGAGVLRKNPPDRYVINYRASYVEESQAIVGALVDQGGIKIEDIAFFTQRDVCGDAGYTACIAALKRRGLKDGQQLLHTRYDRNTLAVEDAVAEILSAAHTPRAIIMVGAYAPCAKFIKLTHEVGLDATFINMSFVGSRSLAEELGRMPVRVLVSEVVPHPVKGNTAIAQDYLADLKMINPNAKPGSTSLEGYIAARILVLAMGKVRGPLTREAIVDAVEGLGQFDLGLGEPLKFGPEAHQACHHVWLTSLQDGELVPFPWTALPALVEKDLR